MSEINFVSIAVYINAK